MTTMVVNSIVKQLLEIGFSEYEARGYISLLKINRGTAYEIAKDSGVPTSKIYGVLSKLLERNVVSVLSEGKKKFYFPLAPEELIARKKSRTLKTLETLEDSLGQIKNETQVSYIWNISDYTSLLEKANRIILNSRQNLLISGWDEELVLLQDNLSLKEAEGVKIAVIHFGETSLTCGMDFHHPIGDTLYSEKGGRGFTLVSDSKEALSATVLEENDVEGAWSLNKGFVIMAEDYIKHDIYMMKIISRMDRDLQRRFGKNYFKLRDIFSDEEEV